MDAETRRKGIYEILNSADAQVSASALASHFKVSRQIIVGDIALLRASGKAIIATPRGYVIQKTEPKCVRKIVCRHGYEEMQSELNAIVDEGCTVIDVSVEHPLYGQLTGLLHLSSRHDVEEFMEESRHSDAQPLSFLTEGIHIHTISCPDEAAYERVINSLEKLHILITRT